MIDKQNRKNTDKLPVFLLHGENIIQLSDSRDADKITDCYNIQGCGRGIRGLVINAKRNGKIITTNYMKNFSSVAEFIVDHEYDFIILSNIHLVNVQMLLRLVESCRFSRDIMEQKSQKRA